MTRLTLLCCIIGLLAACGCEDRTQRPPAAGSTSPSTQATAVQAHCVICVDHRIDVDANTPTLEYKGERYYFCSDHCKTEFNKDPDKSLAVFENRRAAHTKPH